MHKCPTNGCNEKVPTKMLFCRTHWFMVPKTLRDAVWNEFRKQPGSDSHQMACQAAIEAVNDLVSLEGK